MAAEVNGDREMRRLMRTSFFSWEFAVFPVGSVIAIGVMVWLFLALDHERSRRLAEDIGSVAVERLEGKIAKFEKEFTVRGQGFDAIEKRQRAILKHLNADEQ